MPCPAAGLRQIDTAEKACMSSSWLRVILFSFFARFRPPEASLLQALGCIPRSLAIPRTASFSRIALRVGKQKDRARSARFGITTAGRAPDRRVLQIPCACPSIRWQDRCARGWLPDAEHDQASSTAMSCRNVLASNPGFHFDAESAGQKHCQFTAAARMGNPPPATNLWGLCGSLPWAFCLR